MNRVSKFVPVQTARMPVGIQAPNRDFALAGKAVGGGGGTSTLKVRQSKFGAKG